MNKRSADLTTGEARAEFGRAQKGMFARFKVETESHFVRVPSLEGDAHVSIAGQGSTVVLINGIGTPGAMWAPLMSELTGFRLYAVDLPGFGLTDTQKGLARDFRKRVVAFLSEVLDGLTLDRVAIIGNSLGSLCASWLALDTTRVKAMIHIGCPAIVLGTSAPFPMRLLSSRFLGRLITRLQPPSPKQVEQLTKMVHEHPVVPELSDLLVATERLPAYREAFLTTARALLRLRGSRPETRLTASQLQSIRQPTLVVWGRNDPMGSPEVGRQIVATMPNAELYIAGGGHAPWLSQSTVIAPIARSFLERHGA